jgi:TonB-linked SusC/RagA family outer membrane protein
MKKYILLFLNIFCLSFSTLAQQTIEVEGTVTDTNKQPLIGVNVVVKDVPGMGTITNIQGKYKIKMESYQRLVFSYIGFEKEEVLIKEQRVVNVQMKEAKLNTLNEIVVTGMGAQKKLTVTGAITNVGVDQLKLNPTASLVNSLAGNVAGVMAMQTSGQPGKDISEFWIRGISTFGANTSAYVLVDGFPRDINDVNVEDIESFSVLKDASATAIYGDKGANGVILITTKHGKAGKVNIQAKLETSYNTRTITPDVIDGNEYAAMVNEAKITRNQEPIYSPDEIEIIRRNLDPDLYPNVNWKSVLLKKRSPDLSGDRQYEWGWLYSPVLCFLKLY